MAEQKKTCRRRLVPFFRSQIGNCPGVVWECEQESMFRVPWRHFKNKDRTDEDCQILKEWAKYTKKYSGTDDYPKWKTQVRCALNKSSEIVGVPSRDKVDITYPYRVFQFNEDCGVRKSEFSSDCRSPLTHYSPSCEQETFDCSNSAPSPQVVNKHAHVSAIEPDFLLQQASPHWQGGLNHDHYNAQDIQNNQIPTVVHEVPDNKQAIQKALYMQNDFNPQRQLTQQSGPGQNMLTSPQLVNYSTSPCANYTTSVISDIQVVPTNQNEVTDILRHMQESMETSMPSDLRSLPSMDLIPNQDKLPSMPSWDDRSNSVGNPVVSDTPSASLSIEPIFTMTLSYGFNQKMKVLEDEITTQGCNLYSDLYNLSEYRKNAQVFGPSHVKQIEIPSPDQCMTNEHTKLNDKYNNNIMELLQNMDRGITFTIDQEGLYVQRLCKTRVFVTDKISQSILLKRDEPPMKIFNFMSRIIEPIYLTIGQEITKNDPEPLRRVLICLKIEHIQWKKHLENFEAQETGNSLELLISANIEDDNVVDQLKRIKISHGPLHY